MAQETAASVTAPEGPLWRAWLDAFIHLEYETYARWYPRMNARWRRISLVVSLLLIFATGSVRIASSTAYALPALQPLTLDCISAYLASAHGFYELFSYTFGSVAMVYAIPIVIAWRANRSIGPYPVRLRVVFGTWLQVQPAVCVLLLVSAANQLILSILGVSQSTSGIAEWVTAFLVGGSTSMSLFCSCEALAAGSGRYPYRAGLVAAGPAILIFVFFLILLPAILGWLGHPVL